MSLYYSSMRSCQGSGDGGGAVSILQVRNLRLRDVKALDQGHTASRWQSRDGNSGSSSLPIFPLPPCQSPGAPQCPGGSSGLHLPPPHLELQKGCSRGCHLRGSPYHLLISTAGAASQQDERLVIGPRFLCSTCQPGLVGAPYLYGTRALGGGTLICFSLHRRKLRPREVR